MCEATSIHISLIGLVECFYLKHFLDGIFILGKSPLKWRQRPDMTIAVDWDDKPQCKQTKTKMHELRPQLSYSVPDANISFLKNANGNVNPHLLA